MAALYAALCLSAVAVLLVALGVLTYVVVARGIVPGRNASTATYALMLAALACNAAWFGVSSTMVFRPLDNTLLSTDPRGHADKVPQLFRVEKALVLLSFVFGTGAALNISLIWIKIVSSTKSLTSNTLRYLDSYRRVIYLSEFVFLLVLVPCFAASRTEIAVFASLPFYVGLGIIYFQAQRKLVMLLRTISEFQTSSDKQRQWCLKQIRRVHLTCLAMAASLCVTVAFTAGWAGLYLSPAGWMEWVGNSETFGALQICYMAIPFGNLFLGTCVAVYAVTSLLALKKKSRHHALSSSVPGQFSETPSSRNEETRNEETRNEEARKEENRKEDNEEGRRPLNDHAAHMMMMIDGNVDDEAAQTTSVAAEAGGAHDQELQNVDVEQQEPPPGDNETEELQLLSQS